MFRKLKRLPLWIWRFITRRSVAILLILIVLLFASILNKEFNFLDSLFCANAFWFTSVLIPFLTNILATFAALSIGYDLVAKDREHLRKRRELSHVIEFWQFPGTSAAGCFLVYGGEKGSYLDDKPTTTSIATVDSVAKLKETLKKVHGDSFPIEEKLTSSISDWSSLKGRDLIVLGGYLAIPKMEAVQVTLNLPFEQYFLGTHDLSDRDERKIAMNTGESVKTKFDNRNVTTDFAMVTRIFDKTTHRTILWFSGNTGIGTYASVLYFTSPDCLSRCHAFDEQKSVQFLVHVTSIINNEIDSSHKAIDVPRNPEVFECDSPKIVNAMFT